MRKITLFLLFLFFLLEASAAFVAPISDNIAIYQKDKISVFYKNNVLFLQGMVGPGEVEIYSIIGNKISRHQLVDLYNAKIIVDLNLGHMYIVRVRYQGNIIKTFKILAS